MKIKGILAQYERIEIELDGYVDADRALFVRPDGKRDTVYPFYSRPIEFRYDEEGIEHVEVCGEDRLVCRYTPDEVGEYSLEIFAGDRLLFSESFEVRTGESHGYVEVSKKDRRYFEYSDGTPFVWLGINLCFPTTYAVSSGSEFGLSGNVAFVGLNQYRRWFKQCAQNGVNVVRIWLGHSYWSPDTENAYELDPIKLSKIDALVELARSYGLKLKLTLEQFRHFSYDVRSAFHKQLYLNGEPCRSSNEWLTDKRWSDAWMHKVEELAKRYAGDTSVVMVELWNEMNCVGGNEDNPAIIVDWNKVHLDKVKELFPRQLVSNSLGSLDCERNLKFYRDFCWDSTDVVQMHRYIDQGAPHKICSGSPIPSIKDGFELISGSDRPYLLAETGAVNNCHSSHFKYYSSDDRGTIFVDTVYTPVFVGSAGCGNVWHWDERYVDSKGLYKYFKPLSKLLSGIDFVNEEFVSEDHSNDGAYILVLSGKSVTLGFVRNKSDNWQNTLRDMKEVLPIDLLDTEICADMIELYPIWSDESASATVEDGKAVIRNLRYGTLFRITK